MSSSSAASSPSLCAAIQEVADALARHDFEDPAAAYALVSLVPIDGSAAVCAAWEWEYAALCLELLPGSVVLELHRRLPSLPWALAMVLPSSEEVPPIEEEEEVVAPVATRTVKGQGKAKAIKESHPEKHHSAPSGSRACVPRTHIEIVDEGEDVSPSSPEVAPHSLSGSSGSGLPAPDPDVTATRSCSRQAAPVMDNAKVGPSKSTPVGEKRPHDKEEGMPPPKHVRFQVPDVGSRVFDAHNPSQLLGVVASIPTRPPPPPSAPSASDDHSLQERVTAMEARQAHLEARIGTLEYNGQVFQAWVAMQQYENQTFCRTLEVQATEFREMVAALMHTLDQDHSATARELQRGHLFQSTVYPMLHLAECYFLDHPSACTSPLEDYPIYGRADETEERAEAVCDHEPIGEDSGENFGKWCEEEEEEEEGWGLNDDECDVLEAAVQRVLTAALTASLKMPSGRIAGMSAITLIHPMCL
ncbi:hypothetical protein NEOLEDRAFT_1183925 [Neolentinus lepideus HHB14362 ss-1]|uniref:Uncharacterized protein n=1 Tax=Neolentinus lepideus HHB14362 ss-1 TaxID=1314782 RepID=A0A165MW93_9AGAM|nr:hypothetical protein NEOLEDRAFT_1183925 [Neolentinus lepideus HHB14362 ss-1]